MRLAVVSGMAAAALFAPAAAQDALPSAATPFVATTQDPLQRALEPYAVYQQDVTSLRTMEIDSAADLARALDLSAHHHYPFLARGVIAYGALAAAQDQNFVQAARDAEAYFGRDAFIALLTRTPAYARTLRGGPEAGQLAMNALDGDVSRVSVAADRYLGLFSDLTRVSWGRSSIRNADARDTELAALGSASATRPAPDTLRSRLYAAPASVSPSADPNALGGRGFWDAVTGLPTTATISYTAQRWQADADRIVAIDRMLALAALHAIGAERDRSDVFDNLLQEPFLANCFAAAQSGLLGCQQSSSRNHEQAFCIAKHALGWGEGAITVNSVALCMGRLFQPAPTPMQVFTPVSAAPDSAVAGGSDWRPVP